MSFGASSAGGPILLELTDAAGNRLGTLDATAKSANEIPSAARLPLGSSATGADEIFFVAAPDATAYDLRFVAPAGASTVRLSLVASDANGLVLVTYAPVSVGIGGSGTLHVDRGASNRFALSIDTDGDHIPDRTLDPLAVEPIADHPPTVLGVHQWAKGDLPAGDADVRKR